LNNKLNEILTEQHKQVGTHIGSVERQGLEGCQHKKW